MSHPSDSTVTTTGNKTNNYRSMAPKQLKQPCDQCDQKPDPKGKRRADPPSHQDAGDQAGPSGSDHRAPKGRKTKSQKKKEQDDAEDEAGNVSSDDSIFRDMAGPNPHGKLINHFLVLPRAATTANPGSSYATAVPGPSTTDTEPLQPPKAPWREDASSSTSSLLQPPARDEASSSASSLLQPPTREGHSSSASSRGSKRRREASPRPPRRRAPSPRPYRRREPSPIPRSPPRRTYSPPRRAYSPPRRAYSPPRRTSPPPRRTPSPDPRVAMLEQQVRHHQQEIVALRSQLSQEFQVGFTHGRSRGFDEARDMATAALPDER